MSEEEGDFVLAALLQASPGGSGSFPCVALTSCMEIAGGGAATGRTAPWRCPCWGLSRGSLPPTGIFIYPLEESEVVSGFEAVVGSRRVTFQVQNRHRAQDCCLQCGPSPGRPRRCAGGECGGEGGPVGSSWPGGSERAGTKRGEIRGAESPCQATLLPWGGLWGWNLSLPFPLLGLYPSLCVAVLHLRSVVPFESNRCN